MKYRDRATSEAERIGQAIYHEALGDRRGFRPDQIGIPEDDDVWGEIFESLAHEAIEAMSTT